MLHLVYPAIDNILLAVTFQMHRKLSMLYLTESAVRTDNSYKGPRSECSPLVTYRRITMTIIILT